MALGAGRRKLVSFIPHWVDGFEKEEIKKQQVLWKCG